MLVPCACSARRRLPASHTLTVFRHYNTCKMAPKGGVFLHDLARHQQLRIKEDDIGSEAEKTERQ